MPRNRRMTRLSANMRWLRVKNDYTQQFIADLLGVTRYAVCKYESGDRVPNTLGLRKIAHMYQITIDDLLNADMSGVFAREEPNEQD